MPLNNLGKKPVGDLGKRKTHLKEIAEHVPKHIYTILDASFFDGKEKNKNGDFDYADPNIKSIIGLLLNCDKQLEHQSIKTIVQSRIKIQIGNNKENTIVMSLFDMFKLITNRNSPMTDILPEEDLQKIDDFILYYGSFIQQYLNHVFYTEDASKALLGYENLWALLSYIYEKLGLFTIQNGKRTINSKDIILAIVMYIEYQHKLALIADAKQTNDSKQTTEANSGGLKKILEDIQEIENIDSKYDIMIPPEQKIKFYYIMLLGKLKTKIITPEDMEIYIRIFTNPNYYPHIDSTTKTSISLSILEYIKTEDITPELHDLFIQFGMGQEITTKGDFEHTEFEDTLLRFFEYFETSKEYLNLFQIYLYKIGNNADEEEVVDLGEKCIKMIKGSKWKSAQESYLLKLLENTIRNNPIFLKHLLHIVLSQPEKSKTEQHETDKLGASYTNLLDNEHENPTENQYLEMYHKDLLKNIEGLTGTHFLDNKSSEWGLRDIVGENDIIIKQDLYALRNNFIECKDDSNFSFGMNLSKEIIKKDPDYISSTHFLTKKYIESYETVDTNQISTHTTVLMFTKFYDQITNYFLGKDTKESVRKTMYELFPQGISTKSLKQIKTILFCLQEEAYQKQNGKGLLFKTIDSDGLGLDLPTQESIRIVNIVEYYQTLCHAFKHEINPGEKALELLDLWSKKGYLPSGIFSGFQQFIENTPELATNSTNLPETQAEENIKSAGDIVDALYEKFIDEIEEVLRLAKKYEAIRTSTKDIVKKFGADTLEEIITKLGYSCTIVDMRHIPTLTDFREVVSLSEEQKENERTLLSKEQISLELIESLQEELQFYSGDTTPLDKSDLISSFLERKHSISLKNIEQLFELVILKGFYGIDIDYIYSAQSIRCVESVHIFKDMIGTTAPIKELAILNNPPKYGIRNLSNLKNMADGSHIQNLLDYFHSYITRPQDSTALVVSHFTTLNHLASVLFSLCKEKDTNELDGFGVDIAKLYVFKTKGGSTLPIKRIEGKNILIDENESKTHLFSFTQPHRFYQKIAPKLLQRIDAFEDGILQKYHNEEFLSEKLVKLYEQEDLFKDFLYTIRNSDQELYTRFCSYLKKEFEGIDIENYLDYFTECTDELLKNFYKGKN